jgi:hypothetical protein
MWFTRESAKVLLEMLSLTFFKFIFTGKRKKEQK